MSTYRVLHVLYTCIDINQANEHVMSELCFGWLSTKTLIIIIFVDIGTTSTRVPPQHWRTARRERRSCGRNSRRSPETWSLKAVCLNCAVKETARAHHQPLQAGSPCCSAPSPPCSHGACSSAQQQSDNINTQTFLAHIKRRIRETLGGWE